MNRKHFFTEQNTKPTHSRTPTYEEYGNIRD